MRKRSQSHPELRSRAEERLRQLGSKAARGVDPELARLVQELQVHQAELEIQNEELQEARGRLEELSKTYAELYDLAPVAYFTLGRSGDVLRANLAGAALLGLDRSQLVGRLFRTLLPPKNRPDFDRFLSRIFGESNGDTKVYETNLQKGFKELSVRIDALVSADRQVCLAAVFDLTEDRRREAELARALARAEDASRAKGDFVANVSHEIRTPLNAVIGFTDLLFATSLTDVQRRFLGVVKSSGESLLSVVNDVLDVAKMEAGRLDFVDEPFGLREVADKVGRTLGVQAHRKGLELAIEVLPSVPTLLVGDPGRLRQVLVNLVGNAVKFTEKGEVHLSVRAAREPASSDGRAWLEFSVRDTGPGIPPGRTSELFQSFQQLDSSRTRRHEGTGLGLFLSRRIVEQLGGSIQVKSPCAVGPDGAGPGTAFTFTVPFAVPERGAEEDLPGSEELRGVKVLVVDDNATSRRVLSEMLLSRGMRVTEAEGGEEALALLRSGAGEGGAYGLLLVDGRMPGLSGFELIDRARADGGLPPAVLLLTTDDLATSWERAREGGETGTLLKPVSRPELFAEVARALGQPPAGGARDAPEP